jgi:signal transduction histidine kinase
MRKVVLFAAFLCLLLMPAAFVSAADSGTAAEAKAMLEKAVAALKANQADALDKFGKADGGFKDRDLYVFCFNAADGKFTAHPSLMGTDIRALKDKSGKAFGEEIFTAATEGKIAQVAYVFPRPGTTDPVPKESFVTRVGDQGCGVGYYK